MSFLTSESSKRRPIRRLASKTVLMGFMADWFLAAWGRCQFFWVPENLPIARNTLNLLTITNETLALGEGNVRGGGTVTLVWNVSVTCAAACCGARIYRWQ